MLLLERYETSAIKSIEVDISLPESLGFLFRMDQQYAALILFFISCMI